MRRRLVLVAVAGIIGVGAPIAMAAPPDNPGTQKACAALDNDGHGSQGGQSGGPPEDTDPGTATAEAVLSCSDSD